MAFFILFFWGGNWTSACDDKVFVCVVKSYGQINYLMISGFDEQIDLNLLRLD